MFNMFKKKDQSPGSGSASVQDEPPRQTQQAATPNTQQSEDMFGGMKTTRRRKKGQETSAEAAPSEVSQPASEEPKEKNGPFFQKFDAFADNASFGTTGDGFTDDPATAHLRERLERFYQTYNPSKLSAIDKTMKSFQGREGELFDALVKKYGPEPESAPSAPPSQKPSPATKKKPKRAARNEEEFEVPERAPVNDSGPATDGQWGEEPAPTGFGEGTFQDQAFATDAGGFGDEGGFAQDATFGDDGFNATDEGFAFQDPQATGDEGFGFDAPAEDEKGFGFDDKPVEEKPTGFDFQSQDREAQDEDVASNAPTSSSSEDGKYAQLEKQEKRLDNVHEEVDRARRGFMSTVQQLAKTSIRRQSLLAEYSRLEAKIDELTALESYEEADQANEQLNVIGKQIDDVDEEWRSIMRSDLRKANDAVSTSLTNAAQSYSQERGLLMDTQVEEERKVKNYVSEMSHKLEQISNRVNANLEKANRAMSNTEKELENLAAQQKKLEERIADQTKDLRDERDKVTTVATKLEKEIRELEQLLSHKRRNLAEKKATLTDIDVKLQVITDDNAEAMTSVQQQTAEETSRLKEVRARVADLSNQRERNEEEKEELEQETQSMKNDLKKHANSIEQFEKIAGTIQTELLFNFRSFFETTVDRVVRMRTNEGAFCLMAQPHTTDSSDANKLAQLKAQLTSVQQRIGLKADQESGLALRLQEIQKTVPMLEAAKKSAAQAKQFKEAQAKTEELKRLAEEKAETTRTIASIQSEIAALKDQETSLGVQKEAEAKVHRRKMKEFTDAYCHQLQRALAMVESATPEMTSNLGVVAGRETAAADDLAAAVKSFVQSMFEELATVVDIPVEQLLQPTSPTKQHSSPATPEKSTNDLTEVGEPVENSGSGTPDEPQNDAPEQDEPDTQDEPEGITDEDAVARVVQLQTELAEAMEEEAYDRCEEIMQEINGIKERNPTADYPPEAEDA